MMRVAIFISGRGTNMQALLKAARRGRLPEAHIALVLSDNLGARGLQIAKRFAVETVVLDSTPYKGRREDYDREVLKILREREIDLICLAGFMRILSPVLIEAYPHRILNIHPALLPSFPGLHAQRQALEHGAKVSGCTVHFVDTGVDTGAILVQKAVRVLQSDTEESLARRILREEHKIYAQALDVVSRGLVRVEGRRVFTAEPKNTPIQES